MMVRGNRPYRQRGRSDRAGFTLTELLIVIVILGILTRLAYPALNALRAHSESAMIGLGTTLQAAQREAVARGHDVRVIFDGTSNRLQLHFDTNSNGTVDGTERVRGVALDRTVVFGRGAAPARAFGAANINLTVGGSTLVFHRNGSASASGGLYLTTTRGASGGGDAKWAKDARAIEIVRATGRVEWWRYNGVAWMRGF
ncbi:MAG: prepilin-type N-terminal cleavage/methylation domain-containing protein [Gemmatimonadales bacterium]|nr:prepilin-type N-terminal cleavage/methylation domain-containing protein [Gemmatimonadales bacterium]